MTGVDRGTAIIRLYPTQPQGRFLKTTTQRSCYTAHNYVSKPFGGIGVLIISYEAHSEAGMSKLIGYARVSTRQQSPTGSGRISWPPAFDPMTCTSTMESPGRLLRDHSSTKHWTRS